MSILIQTNSLIQISEFHSISRTALKVNIKGKRNLKGNKEYIQLYNEGLDRDLIETD